MLTFPPPHLALKKSEPVDHTALNANMAKERLLTRLRTLISTSQKSLTAAQQRYKQAFDERVRPSKHVYKNGDLVFVKHESDTSDLSDHRLRTEVTDPVPIVRVNYDKRYVAGPLKLMNSPNFYRGEWFKHFVVDEIYLPSQIPFGGEFLSEMLRTTGDCSRTLSITTSGLQPCVVLFSGADVLLNS